MPICSMTGFGSAEGITVSGTYHIEIRSVNNRFLEIQIRQPRSTSNLESKIRKVISSAVSRGSIQVSMNSDCENGNVKVTWDENIASEYVRIFHEINETFSIPISFSVSDLIKTGDIIKTENIVFKEDELWEHVYPVLKEAIDSFQISRQKEGEFIAKELKPLLNEIASTLITIEQRASERVGEYAEILRERIRKIIENPPDPQRIATEIALCADRLDISEECTRLRAHIGKFDDDFNHNGPVGKRMGFLLQEMNREANTIGSKANDTEISHLSITLKENIEKIREQIQNIE